MVASLIIFGILSGSLFAVLVGILGAGRKIGFGWAFVLSLLFTLVSDPLPTGEKRWGCIANFILAGAIITLVLFVLAILNLL